MKVDTTIISNLGNLSFSFTTMNILIIGALTYFLYYFTKYFRRKTEDMHMSKVQLIKSYILSLCFSPFFALMMFIYFLTHPRDYFFIRKYISTLRQLEKKGVIKKYVIDQSRTFATKKLCVSIFTGDKTIDDLITACEEMNTEMSREIANQRKEEIAELIEIEKALEELRDENLINSWNIQRTKLPYNTRIDFKSDDKTEEAERAEKIIDRMEKINSTMTHSIIIRIRNMYPKKEEKKNDNEE